MDKIFHPAIEAMRAADVEKLRALPPVKRKQIGFRPTSRSQKR
ncbi:MAG TPA: hypothetical protein VGC73_01925 [Pyrinomonadaceae bacterium]